jgi:hypothetical protein
VFHPTCTVSVRLQFAAYVFSVLLEGVQSAQGMHWIIFLGVGRESHMVHDAYLFFLQFHTSSFGASWWGEMALLFSVWHRVERLSIG